MKSRTASILLLALAAAVPRAGALDFILHSESVVEDGITREQFYVRNDERTNVLLSPPPGWARTDGPKSLTVIPPDVRSSLVRLEKSPLAPDTEFRDAGLETYRRLVQAAIPQGATALQRRGEQDQPLPIFGWRDHEFLFTYDFFGQTYKCSVLFVNLDAREQIMLTCVAPAEGFDAVRDAGLDVLRSWQVVPSKG